MKKLEELEGNECRFPVTEDSPFLFCGEPASRGAYCAMHAKICFFEGSYVRPWHNLISLFEWADRNLIDRKGNRYGSMPMLPSISSKLDG